MIVLSLHYKMASLTQFRFLMDLDRFSRVPFNCEFCAQVNKPKTIVSCHMWRACCNSISLFSMGGLLILQPFHHFNHVTAHSPTLLSLFLCHRLITYVTWRAAHVIQNKRQEMWSSGIVLHNNRAHTPAATKRLLLRFRSGMVDHHHTARTWLPLIFISFLV